MYAYMHTRHEAWRVHASTWMHAWMHVDAQMLVSSPGLMQARSTEAQMPYYHARQTRKASTVSRKASTDDRWHTLAFAVLAEAITAALSAKDTPPLVDAHTRQI